MRQRLAFDKLDDQDSRSDCDSASISSPINAANSPSASNLPTSVTSPKVVFYLIGLLLTATALAKLWMLVTDSFADVRVGIPKEILWLSVAFELWLAFENFRIRDHRLLAFINTLVFGAFAIFGSIRSMLGYGSCGCSGNLELPALLFILIDVAIAAWFLSSTLRRSETSAGWAQLVNLWQQWSPEMRGRLAGFGLFACLIAGLQLPVAAPLRASILGEPPIKAVVNYENELRIGQKIVGTVAIANLSPQPAKIIGITRSCRCFDIREDSVSKIIPANGRLVLPLDLKPNKTGPLYQRVELLLDHPDQFRVNVDVSDFVKGEE